MAFIAFFLLLLALCKLPSTLPIGSALDLSDPTSYSSGNAFLPSTEEEEKHAKSLGKSKWCATRIQTLARNSQSTIPVVSIVLARIYIRVRSNCGSCGHVCEHGMKCCRGVCVDLKRIETTAGNVETHVYPAMIVSLACVAMNSGNWALLFVWLH